MTTVTIKSFDTGITFTDTLILDAAPYNLTNCQVNFLLRLKDGGGSFAASATIVSAPAGTVSYSPSAGFPTAAGKYYQEWEVIGSSVGRRLTFPSDTYNLVKIIEDLNAA